MKEKTIVSMFTLIVSLVCYFYAKVTGKDAVPYVMAGGFIGALVGEAIANLFSKNDNNNGTSSTI